MEASKIEYDLGKNIYGQPVKITRIKVSGGGHVWEIHRGAANQMDDEKTISGLTDTMVICMAESVRNQK